MYSKSTFPGIGLLIVAVTLLMAAGCSDDSTTLTGGPVAGSENDPEYLVVKQQLNGYLDSTSEIFSTGLNNIYQLPTSPDEIREQLSPMGPNDTAQYTYNGGWHVTYISQYFTYFSRYFRDSVQFQVDSTPVEESHDLDYMHYIRNWGYTSNLTDTTHTNMYGYINIEFDDLDQDICSVNGANNVLVEWTCISNDSTIEAIFDMEVTVDDVTMNCSSNYGQVSGCPLGGRLTMTIDESYSVNDGSSTDFSVRSWTVSVNFDDGVAGISVSSEGEVWSYTRQICTPPGS